MINFAPQIDRIASKDSKKQALSIITQVNVSSNRFETLYVDI